jgi:hypothetical protein
MTFNTSGYRLVQSKLHQTCINVKKIGKSVEVLAQSGAFQIVAIGYYVVSQDLIMQGHYDCEGGTPDGYR